MVRNYGSSIEVTIDLGMRPAGRSTTVRNQCGRDTNPFKFVSINCIFQVFYYSVSIFESVGLSTMSAKFANLSVGILSLFMCSWTPYLMGRFNRRTLSLLSCSGCAVSLLCLTLVMYFKVRMRFNFDYPKNHSYLFSRMQSSGSVTFASSRSYYT